MVPTLGDNQEGGVSMGMGPPSPYFSISEGSCVEVVSIVCNYELTRTAVK